MSRARKSLRAVQSEALGKADGGAEPEPRIFLIFRVCPPEGEQEEDRRQSDLILLVIGIIQCFGSFVERPPGMKPIGQPCSRKERFVAHRRRKKQQSLKKQQR